MPEVKSIRFGWETIHTAIDALTYMVELRAPKLIVAVARGGLIPATMLSHRLCVPLETIKASAYEGTRRTSQKPIIIEGWNQKYNDPSVVVVDDIYDSGDTFRAIVAKAGHSMKCHYATLVVKDKVPIGYDISYFAHVPQDAWVHFPWEHNDDR